jgi:RNA recognition motif-containing protein
MDIYIGNLPNTIDSDELNKVFRYVLLPNNFKELMRRLVKRSEKLLHSEIKVIGSYRGATSVRYAHAVIEPDGLARRAIERLDHLSYQGSSLRVREFVTRSEGNERRKHKGQNLYSVSVYNRRVGERRSH